MHLAQLDVGGGGQTRAQQRLARLLDAAPLRQPARRLGQQQGADGKHEARCQTNPEDAAPGLVLGREDGGDAARFRQRLRRLRGRFHRLRLHQADQGGGHQADGQQQLEQGGAASTLLRGQAFSQVQRHDDADQAATDALQQTAQQQRRVAVGQRDQRDAGAEQGAGQEHHPAPAQEVGQGAGEQRRQDGTQ
ncbi:hypothetical protein D3C87_1271840 [compost metagenome]